MRSRLCLPPVKKFPARTRCAALPWATLDNVAFIIGPAIAGILLASGGLGIDPLLDMGRSATNVVGNSVAAAVVAKWEGELDNG